MTRYRALRRIGFGSFAAAFIAAMNWARGVPPERIVFMTVRIDIVPAGDEGNK
jgi:hypothetical protein